MNLERLQELSEEGGGGGGRGGDRKYWFEIYSSLDINHTLIREASRIKDNHSDKTKIDACIFIGTRMTTSIKAKHNVRTLSRIFKSKQNIR